MKIFKNKTGFISTHPLFLMGFGLLLGLVAAYLWINYLNIWNPFCRV